MKKSLFNVHHSIASRYDEVEFAKKMGPVVPITRTEYRFRFHKPVLFAGDYIFEERVITDSLERATEILRHNYNHSTFEFIESKPIELYNKKEETLDSSIQIPRSEIDMLLDEYEDQEQ